MHGSSRSSGAKVGTNSVSGLELTGSVSVAANPFGAHDFLGAPRGTGDYVIPQGGELTLRYRFVFHKGDANEADVASLFRQYARETSK